MKKIGFLLLIFFSILAGCSNNGSDKKEKTAVSESNDTTVTSSQETIDFTTYNTGIDFDEFIRNPEKMQDKKTIFVAKVIQVMESDKLNQYLATVTPSETETVTVALVINKEKLSDTIIDGDEIRVWVRGLGVYEYTNTLGTDKTAPRFLIDGYDII